MKKLLLSLFFITCFSIFAFAQTSNLICPEIKVIGPNGLVKAGDKITFRIKSEDETNQSELDFEYEASLKWQVSQGVIIFGQGTPLIQVQTSPEMKGTLNVTVTVKIKSLNNTCSKEASETVVIEDPPSLVQNKPDQYSHLSLEDEFAIFDNFLVMLINDPKSKGYIFFEIEKTEDLGEVTNRLKSVFNHIFEKRGFNRDLIIYDICYAENNQTTVQRISEGADLPEVQLCERVYIDLK